MWIWQNGATVPSLIWELPPEHYYNYPLHCWRSSFCPRLEYPGMFGQLFLWTRSRSRWVCSESPACWQRTDTSWSVNCRTDSSDTLASLGGITYRHKYSLLMNSLCFLLLLNRSQSLTLSSLMTHITMKFMLDYTIVWVYVLYQGTNASDKIEIIK